MWCSNSGNMKESKQHGQEDAAGAMADAMAALAPTLGKLANLTHLDMSGEFQAPYRYRHAQRCCTRWTHMRGLRGLR